MITLISSGVTISTVKVKYKRRGKVKQNYCENCAGGDDDDDG